MRIEEIHVDGFGHLKGARVTLQGGLACVAGDNEAGKSTLLAFVRGVLFGFTHVLTKEQRDHMGVDGRSAATTYDPVEGGNKGGTVTLVVDEEGAEVRYRFTRTEVRKKDGDLVITDLTRNKEHKGEDAERLRARLLSGTDAVVFGTVFAIGLDELHAVKALDKDAVQGVLFAADAGIGADIATEMDDLGKVLAEHHKPRGKNQRVNMLQRELRDLDKEIRQARDDVAAHRGDQETYGRLSEDIETLEKACAESTQEAARAERRMQARTILGRLEHERTQAAPFADRVLPTTDDRERHAALRSEAEAAARAEAEARETLEALRTQREALRFDDRDAEAALVLPTIDPQELDRLVASARQHEALRSEEKADEGPHVSASDRAALVKLDERITHLADRVAQTKAQVEQAQKRIVEAERAVLEDADEARLRSALQEDAAEVSRERTRRVKAHEEAAPRTDRALAALGPDWDRERLGRAATDHATEAKVVAALTTGTQHLQRQVGWSTVAIGIALLAVGALGLADILLDAVAGTILAIAGLLVAGHGLAGRKSTTTTESIPLAEKTLRPYGLPGTTSRDDFRGFIATLRDARGLLDQERHCKQTLREIEERWRGLESSVRETAQHLRLEPNGPLDDVQARLLERLEAAQYARSTVRTETTALEDRQRERQLAEGALGAARRERAELFAVVGLAEDAPAQVVRAALTASEAREERRRRIEGLGADSDRAERILRDVARAQQVRGAPAPDLDALARTYRTLHACCTAAAEAKKEAERLDRDLETAEKTLARRAATARSASEELAAFYERFRCKDAASFQDVLKVTGQAQEIQGRIRTEEQRLVDLESNDPQLREQLERTTADEDAALLADHEGRLERMHDEIAKNREASKEVYARIARVAQQDELTGLLQRRDALQQQYDDAVTDWLRIGLTLKLLEKVRARYEREHGPKVLQEASRILSHITDGRYDGIGREPDGTYVLTRPDGRRVPAVPPNVSRATFAQVYLAVRLAYAEVHDTNGTPYLLDDVLSDFDDGRLERAIDVLVRLAARRQVILFTHHGHVAERAAAAGLVVTRLEPQGAVRPIVK